MTELETYIFLQATLQDLANQNLITSNDYFYYSANLDDMHSFYCEKVKE
nr:hypothetical protein [uncultured Lachnoclostridium sp.]